MTLANTTENNNLIKALKTVNECSWVGNTKFNDLDKCLRSIGLQTFNSGLYTMVPVRLKGLKGIYLINEDKSLCYDFRVIKENDFYLIETLTTSGLNDFETVYSNL